MRITLNKINILYLPKQCLPLTPNSCTVMSHQKRSMPRIKKISRITKKSHGNKQQWKGTETKINT